VIPIGYPLPALHLVGEYLKLDQKDGSLKGIEPAGQTNPNVLIALSTGPVDTDGSHNSSELLVITEDCATIAIAAKRLGWVK
jgi:hypothetical protein